VRIFSIFGSVENLLDGFLFGKLHDPKTHDPVHLICVSQRFMLDSTEPKIQNTKYFFMRRRCSGFS
jgi:hypothetical protein